jgi:hypothetical protein
MGAQQQTGKDAMQRGGQVDDAAMKREERATEGRRVRDRQSASNGR